MPPLPQRDGGHSPRPLGLKVKTAEKILVSQLRGVLNKKLLKKKDGFTADAAVEPFYVE